MMHIKEKLAAIDWGNTIFILGYHLALIIGLPFYYLSHSPAKGLYLVAALLVYLPGLAISIGYHRLYSHKTFKTHPVIETILLFFGSLATQGSAIKWGFEHRHHHAYVDTDKDPYSIKKGFLFAHILWMFKKAKPIDKKVVADLYANKLLAFQHRFYAPIMLITNILVTLLLGYLFNDYLGSLIICWGIRLFFLHHFTWFINSAAHTWGSQSISKEHSAVNNYILSFFTFGEGYHNYHHTFANDYRVGARWYQFDPGKWIIWLLSRFHLTRDLKRANYYRVKEKMLKVRTEEIKKMIKNSMPTQAHILEKKVEAGIQKIQDQIQEIRSLITKYQIYKKDRMSSEKIRSLKLKIKEAKKGIKRECKEWNSLSRSILHTKTT